MKYRDNILQEQHKKKNNKLIHVYGKIKRRQLESKSMRGEQAKKKEIMQQNMYVYLRINYTLYNVYAYKYIYIYIMHTCTVHTSKLCPFFLLQFFKNYLRALSGFKADFQERLKIQLDSVLAWSRVHGDHF